MNRSGETSPRDEHNRRLDDNVRPADWINPAPEGRYQLVVVGAGTAGLVTAAAAAGLGARVALIERQRMGGDCLNVGCVPSKTLIRAARAVQSVRDAARFGVQAASPHVDFAQVMQRLRQVRADISPDDSAERFRQMGVDVYFGQASFTAPDRLQVASATLHFSRAVIATGTRAHVPDVPGLAEGDYLTNENVFELTELPPRLAVLGGGSIGCELAQAFARLGAHVTLIEKSERLLPRDEPAAAQLLAQQFAAERIDLRFSAALERVENRDGAKHLHLRQADQTQVVAVDAILVAIGRRPNVENLGLDQAGVAFDPQQGVIVDDFLRTTNRRVYAAGDICSRFKFTHAADALARIAVQNALFAGRARVSRLVIPWCTYTDPEVAQVGLTLPQAHEQFPRATVFRQELREVNRAHIDGDEVGFAQVVTTGRSDKIVGATIVAAHAGDMIGQVALAMTAGLGLKDLSRTIHPYPTRHEVLRKLGDAYQRSRLTPKLRRLSTAWLRWFR